MAVIKQKTRRKLSKTLARLVKKHGPEMTLALVTGIISALVAERSNRPPKPPKASKKAGKAEKTDKLDAREKPARKDKAPARTAVSRKRASA
jgi:hypothetical protein